MKFVIGITGKIGSGKGTLARYLSEKYSAPVYLFSKILHDILQRLHLEPTRENFQKLGASLRNELGESAIVNALKKDIEANDSKVIIIDGIRYLNEVDMLRKFEKNLLIAIDAPARLRYVRCLKRGEKKGEQKKKFEEFLEEEKQETEREIDDVIEKADYKVENTRTKEELLKEVDEILDKVKVI